MKVALVQQAFHGTKKETVLHTVSMIEEASENGVDLIVLQELHQTEY